MRLMLLKLSLLVQEKKKNVPPSVLSLIDPNIELKGRKGVGEAEERERGKLQNVKPHKKQ